MSWPKGVGSVAEPQGVKGRVGFMSGPKRV